MSKSRILPRDRAPTDASLPWILALLTMVATLLAAAAFAIADFRRDFAGAPGQVTLAIIEADGLAREEKVADVLTRLRAAPEVARAERVPAAEVERLVTPWLGRHAGQAVPLPALIDVAARDPSQPIAAIAKRIAPSAELAEHDEMAAGPLTIAAWACAAGSLIAILAAGWMVIGATAARLSRQREAITLIHRLGASDHQILWPILIEMARPSVPGVIGGAAVAVALVWLGSAAVSIGFPAGSAVGAALLVAAAVLAVGLSLATLRVRYTLGRLA
ncbi:FtsX-like permease family protein [Sphingomonas sp. ID0503]|uniref:FtsX-like permease family protein n=1 Tax=Sphingomonas sp. ID0503 TaxID=3399691 RepID=UPI003AFAD9CF